MVGSSPLDGTVSPDRLVLIDSSATRPPFVIIAVEDLIADRMGQYASGTAREMRAQAQALLRLHANVDLEYLDKRVRYETAGEYGASDVEG